MPATELADERLAALIARVCLLHEPPRASAARGGHYEGLAEAIVGQQLSPKAAEDDILAREGPRGAVTTAARSRGSSRPPRIKPRGAGLWGAKARSIRD